MPHHQPSSTSKYAKIFSFSASNEFHTRPWTKWHFWKGRKNRRMTLTQFTNAWQLSELYWSNKSRHCCLVSPSLNINYLDTEESSFLPWCEVILHTHTHTHNKKKTHPRHTFTTQTSSHIQTDSDTHRFSPLLPTSSTLTNSPPPNSTQSQTHTHTHTLAQSVWSVNLVPRGARRVTPLTGQTRLDSQQTDKY